MCDVNDEQSLNRWLWDIEDYSERTYVALHSPWDHMNEEFYYNHHYSGHLPEELDSSSYTPT